MSDDPARDPAVPPTGLPDPVRRRLHDVFGEVLPDVTRDEVGDVEGDRAATAEEWLRANRPPHHGG